MENYEFTETLLDFQSNEDELPTERNSNLGWGTEAGEFFSAHN
jgi:hypothetical protein